MENSFHCYQKLGSKLHNALDKIKMRFWVHFQYIYIYIHELRLPFYEGILTDAAEVVKSVVNCYIYAFSFFNLTFYRKNMKVHFFSDAFL